VINGASAVLTHDVQYGDAMSVVPGRTADDPLQLRRAKPFFRAPPPVDTHAEHPQGSALAPWLVGRDLMPKSGSPLVDRGIDLRTVPGMTPELRATALGFLTRDLRGISRPQGAAWDVGAYELRPSDD
jgi:hypothetical protein